MDERRVGALTNMRGRTQGIHAPTNETNVIGTDALNGLCGVTLNCKFNSATSTPLRYVALGMKLSIKDAVISSFADLTNAERHLGDAPCLVG